jgi:hypothetical protein
MERGTSEKAPSRASGRKMVGDGVRRAYGVGQRDLMLPCIPHVSLIL